MYTILYPQNTTINQANEQRAELKVGSVKKQKNSDIHVMNIPNAFY